MSGTMGSARPVHRACALMKGARSVIEESADKGSVHVMFGSQKTRIVLTGDIDATIGQELREAAIEVESKGLPIEIDSHRITFLDSTGVAFLARLASRSRSRVIIIKPPQNVRFLLGVTRIGDLLTIVDDDPGADDTIPDVTA